jgi:hypothetical protein
MRRRPGASFRVYEEDEFFAAPVEEWLSEAAAPAAQPRFRRLAGGALIAGAIFVVGGALARERLPASGGSPAGAMVGADGSRTRYLAAGSASVPIPVRLFGSAPQGSVSSPPARASRARAGAAAKGHPRAPKAQVVAVRARMAARAGSVRTRASVAAPASLAAPASVAAPVTVTVAGPVPAAATATAGQGLASAPRVAAAEPAARASATADGRPVASASGGASRREHPEFGFER